MAPNASRQLDERGARMALAAVTTATERAGIETQVRRDGAQTAWQLVLDGPDGDPTTRRARELDLDALRAETDRQGSRFVIPGDAEWAHQLDDLDHPSLLSAGGVPLGLWLTGRPLVLRQPVAVVGARSATGYGTHLAEQLGHDLAQAGHTVVASLAYGCDVAALRGALAADVLSDAEDARPHPVVVLASGHSRPLRLQGHERLVEQLADDATLVSEHPPTAPLTRAGTIGRARILAGLASAVVLVEAAERSGALLTMDAAQWLGRLCGAVPGPVTSALSTSPNELIAKGHAHLVTSAEDVMHDLAAMTVADDQEEGR